LSFKIYPTGNPLLAHLSHPIGHRGHARAVKDRLDDAPMTLPDLPRTGRRAIAQDQRDADWPSRIVNFHKSVRLLDQNFFGEIGMAEEMERLRAEPKTQR